jgi:5-methylcytosine-specific restriction endonuclease McrA
MCEPGDNRRKLSRKQKREIMAAQSNRCAYCLTTFGSVVYWRKRNVRLQIEWDHLVPFAYNRDNRPANFVAACHICNRIKSSLLFQTMDEARAYIQARRDR